MLQKVAHKTKTYTQGELCPPLDVTSSYYITEMKADQWWTMLPYNNTNIHCHVSCAPTSNSTGPKPKNLKSSNFLSL